MDKCLGDEINRQLGGLSASGDVNGSDLLTSNEEENCLLLGTICQKFDEQLQLLQEQKSAYTIETERADKHRLRVENLVSQLIDRVSHTEAEVKALREETSELEK